jgi:hypothetical protein
MGKIDKIKQDNPELNISIIDMIQAMDPSTTNKYCEFLIKMIKNNNITQETIIKFVMDSLFGINQIEKLHKFEEHSKANRILQEFKDISRHNDWFFIEEGIKIADEVVKRKQLEKETKKLFENDEWVVLIPESYEASQLYAYNTKWCITQKSYWNDYKKSSRIIFVINKKNDEKYAISKRMNDSVIQGWDAKDKETSPLIWEFTDEIWKILRCELKKSRQDIEIESLPEGMIYGSRNSVVPFETSSLKELELFYKKFGDHITPEFSKRVINRGKELRELERIEKKPQVKKTIGELRGVSDILNYSNYENYYGNSLGDIDGLLSELMKDYK